MIRGIQDISIPAIRYAMTQGSKMTIPVEPSNLIYSHFEHISGKAAPEGTRGVSISNLKIIDALIRQLNQIKKDSAQTAAQSAAPVTEVPAERLDALIDNYQSQIKAAVAANEVMPYVPSPIAPSGALFSLVA